MNDIFEYQYPDNLNKKYMILVWTVPELILIGFGATLSLILVLNTGNPLALCIVAGIALFTAHFEDQGRNNLQLFYDLAKFLFTPRTWQYIPNATLTVQTESTNKPKGKKKAKGNSFMPLIVTVVLAVIFVVVMTRPTEPATEPAATASPTASSVATASPSASAEASDEPSGTIAAASQAVISINEQAITTTVGERPDYESNVTVTQDGTRLDEAIVSDFGNGAYYIDSSMVDVNTPGSYPVTITAKDSNGVQTTSTFIVNVVSE